MEVVGDGKGPYLLIVVGYCWVSLSYLLAERSCVVDKVVCIFAFGEVTSFIDVSDFYDDVEK